MFVRETAEKSAKFSRWRTAAREIDPFPRRNKERYKSGEKSNHERDSQQANDIIVDVAFGGENIAMYSHSMCIATSRLRVARVAHESGMSSILKYVTHLSTNRSNYHRGRR